MIATTRVSFPLAEAPLVEELVDVDEESTGDKVSHYGEIRVEGSYAVGIIRNIDDGDLTIERHQLTGITVVVVDESTDTRQILELGLEELCVLAGLLDTLRTRLPR